MQSGAVTQIRPVITRMRAIDVPEAKSHAHNAFGPILSAVRANLVVGLAPGEAFEVVPPGPTKYATGRVLVGIKKLIAEGKFPVEAFTRERDGQRLIYIVGV